MARRQTQDQKRRNIILGWWSAVLLLGVWAWQAGLPQLWVLPILTLAYYELCAVPTLCGVETTRGHPCKNRAYGRLMACTREPSHAVYKTDALLRILGIRRNPRTFSAPAPRPHRQTGTQAANSSPEVATIESKQTLITALTIVGTIAAIIQVIFAAWS